MSVRPSVTGHVIIAVHVISEPSATSLRMRALPRRKTGKARARALRHLLAGMQ